MDIKIKGRISGTTFQDINKGQLFLVPNIDTVYMKIAADTSVVIGSGAYIYVVRSQSVIPVKSIEVEV